MNCQKCGYELTEDWRYCPRCSTEINKNQIHNGRLENHNNIFNHNQEENLKKIELKKEVKTADTVVLVTVLAPVVALILFNPTVWKFCLLIMLVINVWGIMTYPKNRVIIICFILFIMFIAASLVAVMVVRSIVASCQDFFWCM